MGGWENNAAVCLTQAATRHADKNTNQQIHKYFPRLDDPVLKMYYLILKSRCLARCSPWPQKTLKRFTQRRKCVYSTRYTQEVYPRPPNILHLPRIWVKCTCVGGKSTPKCNEKDNFHKALPNVKKAYVTLRKFTPDLKIFYTDISAISVPLCNSGKRP